MLRGQAKVDPGQGFSGSDSQDKSKPETEPKMEIILEFIVVTVGVSAVAALILISRFASSSKKLNADRPSWGSE
jgi:hypothetical protein